MNYFLAFTIFVVFGAVFAIADQPFEPFPPQTKAAPDFKCPNILRPSDNPSNIKDVKPGHIRTVMAMGGEYWHAAMELNLGVWR